MAQTQRAPTSQRQFSTRQAASELGVSERTLRRYIVSGLIEFHRLPGGHYRIPHEAIDNFWAEHDQAGRRSCRPTVEHRRARHAVARAEPGADGARRPRLGKQPPTYDLSPAALAELRGRFS